MSASIVPRRFDFMVIYQWRESGGLKTVTEQHSGTCDEENVPTY